MSYESSYVFTYRSRTAGKPQVLRICKGDLHLEWATIPDTFLIVLSRMIATRKNWRETDDESLESIIPSPNLRLAFEELAQHLTTAHDQRLDEILKYMKGEFQYRASDHIDFLDTSLCESVLIGKPHETFDGKRVGEVGTTINLLPILFVMAAAQHHSLKLLHCFVDNKKQRQTSAAVFAQNYLTVDEQSNLVEVVGPAPDRSIETLAKSSGIDHGGNELAGTIAKAKASGRTQTIYMRTRINHAYVAVTRKGITRSAWELITRYIGEPRILGNPSPREEILAFEADRSFDPVNVGVAPAAHPHVPWPTGADIHNKSKPGFFSVSIGTGESPEAIAPLSLTIGELFPSGGELLGAVLHAAMFCTRGKWLDTESLWFRNLRKAYPEVFRAIVEIGCTLAVRYSFSQLLPGALPASMRIFLCQHTSTEPYRAGSENVTALLDGILVCASVGGKSGRIDFRPDIPSDSRYPYFLVSEWTREQIGERYASYYLAWHEAATLVDSGQNVMILCDTLFGNLKMVLSCSDQGHIMHDLVDDRSTEEIKRTDLGRTLLPYYMVKDVTTTVSDVFNARNLLESHSHGWEAVESDSRFDWLVNVAELTAQDVRLMTRDQDDEVLEEEISEEEQVEEEQVEEEQVEEELERGIPDIRKSDDSQSDDSIVKSSTLEIGLHDVNPSLTDVDYVLTYQSVASRFDPGRAVIKFVKSREQEAVKEFAVRMSRTAVGGKIAVYKRVGTVKTISTFCEEEQTPSPEVSVQESLAVKDKPRLVPPSLPPQISHAEHLYNCINTYISIEMPREYDTKGNLSNCDMSGVWRIQKLVMFYVLACNDNSLVRGPGYVSEAVRLWPGLDPFSRSHRFFDLSESSGVEEGFMTQLLYRLLGSYRMKTLLESANYPPSGEFNMFVFVFNDNDTNMLESWSNLTMSLTKSQDVSNVVLPLRSDRTITLAERKFVDRMVELLNATNESLCQPPDSGSVAGDKLSALLFFIRNLYVLQSAGYHLRQEWFAHTGVWYLLQRLWVKHLAAVAIKTHHGSSELIKSIKACLSEFC